MTYRFFYIAIIISICSCKNQNPTSLPAPPKFESVLLKYFPAKYEVGDNIVFQNDKEEETKLSLGTGHNYIPSTKDTLGIQINHNGNIRGKSISIILKIEKNWNNDGKDHMFFGVIGYNDCAKPVWSLSINQDSINKLASKRDGNSTTLLQVDPDSETFDQKTICLPGHFENENCDVNIDYEICLEKRKGISSFSIDGERWIYSRLIKDN